MPDLINVNYNSDRPTASARELWEFLEKPYTKFTMWFDAFKEYGFSENEDYRRVSVKTYTPEGGTQTAVDYEITVDMAKELAMLQKTEKGREARRYFIACEKALKRIEHEHQQWEIERAKGVIIRHVLTDTIKMKIADSPHKRFAYPNYTKLIYKTIFGKTMDELKNEFGVKEKESIREHMTADQLREVESMEMLISGLINIGMGYAEVKNFIENNYNKRLSA